MRWIVLPLVGLFLLFGAASGGAAADSACPKGEPESYTAASTGTFLLFSDVHFDPFADPGKAAALAAAPASQWGDILAETPPVVSPYGQDSNNALLQSFLDDMARRVPRPDFLLFPGDLLCHDFWTRYRQATGDASQAGLTAFVQKTAEYFLTEVTRRFPGVPLYVALGNNDSVEGDYRIAPESPYLAVTAGIIAALALPDATARAAFLATYPKYGCYAVDLPEAGGLRLIVINDIFWSKRYPDTALGGPVLDFLRDELAGAQGRGQKVWVMTHIPPGDNAFASARTYLDKGTIGYKPLLEDAANDAFVGLLTGYAPTIAAMLSGHVHRDYFRLFYADAAGQPVGIMRIAPAISPLRGNNPGYQAYAYDRASLALLDETTYFLDLGASQPAWSLEYVYSKAYGRGLRGAGDWQGVYQGLASCPDWRQAFAAYYDLSSSKLDEVTDRTFPIYWRAAAAPTRAAFGAGPVQ
jgi:hypothetical protein